MRPSSTITYTLASLFAVALACNGFQYFRNSKQEMLLEIEKKRNEINTDQINEFILSSRNNGSYDISTDTKFAESQGFIRGILAVVTKASPQESEISSIWHSGYERGMSQTDFVGEMQYEKGYQSGFNIGQKETMKALSTIMKSGDNVQNAIKDFVENQYKKLDEKATDPVKPNQTPSK